MLKLLNITLSARSSTLGLVGVFALACLIIKCA